MSLIKCEECGHDVSTRAKTCPNCGIKVKRRAFLITFGKFFLVFAGFVILVNMIAPVAKSANVNDLPPSPDPDLIPGWYALDRYRPWDKLGYVDRSGTYILKPHYVSAQRFSEGLAAVKLCVYCTDTPKELSGATREDLRSFDGKWGYIGKEGNLIIKLAFDDAKPFSEGLAAVRIGDKWGFIDNTGELVIKAQFGNQIKESLHFSEGLSAIRVGDKWGFINKAGKFVIKPEFSFADSFYSGLAAVFVGEIFPSYNAKAGYIDATGKVVIKIEFDAVESFSEGLAAVRIGDKWGFIEKTGKLVIKPEFSFVGDFSSELAIVEINEKFGYINKSGRLVIEPKFDSQISLLKNGSFSEGLAAVKIGEKFGYINKIGELVIKPQFDFAAPFHEGVAGVTVGGKMGFIDKTGKFVIKPRLIPRARSHFSEGLVAVKLELDN